MSSKKAFGSIDYLLDILSVVIIGLVAFRTNENLEAKLGEFWETTRILGFLMRGLGASDIPSNTHFLS